MRPEPLAALGSQWQAGAQGASSRRLLVACLRQGLRLARDHQLTQLDWLIDAIHANTADSVWEPLSAWEPLHSPVSATREPGSPDGALTRLLAAIIRRQHEHRQHTADRLTAVLDTGLLPAPLIEMALYYRAKAHKDLGLNDASRADMQQVANANGRLAPKARRSLANLARLSGNFPAALAAVPTLGWESRHHPVLGDIHWSHADTAQAVTTFEASRTEAVQHGTAGECARPRSGWPSRSPSPSLYALTMNWPTCTSSSTPLISAPNRWAARSDGSEAEVRSAHVRGVDEDGLGERGQVARHRGTIRSLLVDFMPRW